MNRLQPDIKPIPFTPERLKSATGGELLCGDSGALFKGISINSRDIGPEYLFIAIKGANHDGHDFVESVLAAGIKGIVISRTEKDRFDIKAFEEKNVTCLVVEDTIKALGDLATSQRIESGVRLVAITGSNGKTSTRAMTAAIFSQVYKTHSTKGNFNNDIGLPLTLLQLGEAHEWAVVELGMNAPGEITELAKICRPDIGIITNAGAAHLEGLGSIENVARAKGELIPAVSEKGTIILNSEMPLVSELVKTASAEVLYFSESMESELQVSDIGSSNGKVSFTLSDGDASYPVTLDTPGTFMVSNALAAATAGKAAGIGLETIKKGLEAFSPEKGRINILKGKNGIHLIDDTYNANPDSMMAAVKTLKNLKGDSRGVFVMGEMKELGPESETFHRKIGAYTAEQKIEELYVTGSLAPAVADGAQNAGMKADYIFTGTKKEIIKTLLEKLAAGDWVLVKGSRSMAMEEIIEGLL